ncbi:hypothetical protein GFK32_22030, partial [Salmonella enterica subsp. enterica serovar Enteritidis]|nr:hypothetical protein [Salmonella enterica subsp. enterica serovar Enteritidis]
AYSRIWVLVPFMAVIKYRQAKFKTLAAQHVDIFIANKGDRFGLLEKRQQLRNGDTQAFFDSNGLQQYVERSRQRFITQLTAQQP